MVDFEEYNAAVKKLWADFHQGKNERVPITFSRSFATLDIKVIKL